jgi:hypothetical protein
MTGSIFTPPYGHILLTNGRITEYTATISRDEYPTWTATVTGGDLPEAGHVFSGLSYARMCDEIMDWLEWHFDGEVTFTITDDEVGLAKDDDYSDELANDEESDSAGDGLGEGFEVCHAYRFPRQVNDALERYWRARKQRADHEIGGAVVDVRNGLRATPEDMARLLCMSLDDVLLTIESEEWRRAGRTEEDWQYFQDHRKEWHDQDIREHCEQCRGSEG